MFIFIINIVLLFALIVLIYLAYKKDKKENPISLPGMVLVPKHYHSSNGRIKDSFKSFFEIHFTIEDNSTNFIKFQEVCKKLKIKAINISFKNSKNETEVHTMTSSVFVSNSLLKVNDECLRIAKALEKKGITYRRLKVEVDPSFIEVRGKSYSYFETHLAFPCSFKFSDFILNNLNLSWFYSKNENKQEMYSITARGYNEKDLLLLKEDIKLLGQKEIIEYAIMDSNQELDDEWFQKYSLLN